MTLAFAPPCKSSARTWTRFLFQCRVFLPGLLLVSGFSLTTAQDPTPAKVTPSARISDAGAPDRTDSTTSPENPPNYASVVLADQPAFYWNFDEGLLENQASQAETPPAKATLKKQGTVKQKVAGPRDAAFPLFQAQNQAIEFPANAGYLVLNDSPIEENAKATSPLRFAQGDQITLEAWVDVQQISNGQQMYILGKGRTRRNGYPAENQNYALRLAGKDGHAVLSFLFRDADKVQHPTDSYHRWNSITGFQAGSGWHHLAVTYTFGEPKSIKGYIDGEAIDGTWDYGGATSKPPMVDDDQLWIGSSLGGNAGSTFRGSIDEVAIYRHALSAERVKAHAKIVSAPPYQTPLELLSKERLLVEVFHGVPDRHNWTFNLPAPWESFSQQDWALVAIPQVYNRHGVRDDRSNPFVVRLSGLVQFPEGTKRLLLRARSGARIWVDDQLVLDNRHPGRSSDGHGAMYRVQSQVSDKIRPLQPGDYEQAVKFEPSEGWHRVQVDLWVGGKSRRPELGEFCVASSNDHENFQVLSAQAPFPLTDSAWENWSVQEFERLTKFNQQRRKEAATSYARYWERRHVDGREILDQRLAGLATTSKSENAAGNFLSEKHANSPAVIDQLILSRLQEAKAEPTPLIDDNEFLRRSTLDVLGTLPTLEQQQIFQNLPQETRRKDWIDWLVQQPGWADHWVAYWQDVLAENPNLVNPTLNNTGPFRFWIHESFSDNKPFDRFATELILMEGSAYFGGPAGFALATENDSPMAAKAHILAQAFMGMEMKCARCHDAPYHDFSQKDLFNLAAMLKRGPEAVPKTSTIPGSEDALKSLLVKVTLKPGQPIPPEWPFADILSATISPDILEQPTDQREQLAAIITSPHNRRFSQVIVNRLWQRYLGRGLVEPVDDWENPNPSHPEILEYLEAELIRSGYDLKHLARLMMKTDLYQRTADAAALGDERQAMLFAGPRPRKLTAEQLVDSLFTASGKAFRTEELNIDLDGLRDYHQSLGFGFPQRAWEFVATNNERDRPSLALPGIQTFINVLETFGWRASRPDPLTLRNSETTVLQPATMANGTLAIRAAQLSDDHRLTDIAIQSKTPEEWIRQAFAIYLVRPPTNAELAIYTEFLKPGFDSRVLTTSPRQTITRPRSTGVSWTNHLQPEANELKVQYAVVVEQGDTPTQRLNAEWRERAEDVIWTLINTPDFILGN